ncbi:hypothetical protein IWQ60_002269 [Tieghemiomyces parasiticus]|uniref:Chitin-binding type-4 domain-containing protein n=1 Tax=Tieghemiomyces parasiticus TaxID=78921 RepID=A0A9W8AF48_9FUNG|nr:hypothetical protein IWQ60_002269 [Tieghemiomyces parasiticus]
MRSSLFHFLAGAALVTAVTAHEFLTSVCIYGSPLPECAKYGAPDYDSASPIASKGAAVLPLCRHPKGSGPVVNYKAGQQVSWVFNEGAIHEGGHCEISFSLDDKNFISFHTVLTKCFLGSSPPTINFQIPPTMPSFDSITIAWSWINASGNREFYHNCATASIDGVAGGVITGYPMVTANYPIPGTEFVQIGEFAYGADPRLDLYNNRTPITLTANGISAGGAAPVNNSTMSSIPAPAATPTATISPVIPVPAPASTSTGYSVSAPVASSSAPANTPVGNAPVTPVIPTTTSAPSTPTTTTPGRKCKPRSMS